MRHRDSSPPRRLRVLFLVTAYPRDEQDVITPWMVETIRQLRARGVDVEVLAPSYRGLGEQTLGGVRVHRFRYAPRSWEVLTHDQTAPDRLREQPLFFGLVPGYLLAGSLAAARLARTGRFDVLHAFWPLPQSLLGLIAKRASGLPLVSSFFGVELTWVASQLRFLAPVTRHLARRSDAVTVISSWTAGLLRRSAISVAPVIIPFGAAVDVRAAEGVCAWSRGGELELLFVGRLVERKGVHVLLEALSLLGAARPVRLHVLGDGPERPALERRAEALGLRDRVVFHGFVSPAEKARRYASCHALVLPAVFDAKGDVEGLGVVLLEAMAFGKPVIASAAGGILDIVRDGVNGLLVAPGDAKALASTLAGCLDDRERLRRMGEAGRDDVTTRFSWPAIAEKLEALYRSVALPG